MNANIENCWKLVISQTDGRTSIYLGILKENTPEHLILLTGKGNEIFVDRKSTTHALLKTNIPFRRCE